MHVRRILVVFLILVFLFASAFPALAATTSGWGLWKDVTTFGFDDYHTRVGDNTNFPVMWPAWYAFQNPPETSYSQPLILDGDYFGKDRPVVIAAIGKALCGFVSKQAKPDGKWQPNPPVWSLPLKGDGPTKSHPTLVDLNGRKLVFIGTEHDSAVGGAWLQVFDVTDFDHPKEVFRDWSKLIHDVVSAPVVYNWCGHLVVITTAGDTGRIVLWLGLDKLKDDGVVSTGEITTGYLALPGRTSSTPSIVKLADGSDGLAVGVDQGLYSGKLAIYKFNDILSENNGKVHLKGKDPFRTIDLPSGLVASFSVSGDRTKLYFGDCRSRVYCYDTRALKGVWVNTAVAGTFSNRSPALLPGTVFFPAVGGTSSGDVNSEGRVIAVDRNTGKTMWVANFDSRAQTAPAVWAVNGYGSIVLEGTRGIPGKSSPAMALLDAGTGEKYGYINLPVSSSGGSYAAGVSGEISVAHDHLVVTTNEGIYAWSAIPIDLEAVSIDSGVPKGQKAKVGQKYTATVVFKYKQDPGIEWPLDKIPVAAFHVIGDAINKASLKDETGAPLQVYEGNKQQVISLNKQGDTVTVKFDWTAQPGSKKLVAALNTFYPDIMNPKLVRYYPELTEKNNLVSVNIEVEGLHDVKATLLPAKTVWKTIPGRDVKIIVTGRATRKDNNGSEIPVRFTVSGPGGPVTKTVRLGPGDSERTIYTFTTSTPGTYRFRAEAWPADSSWEDAYPPDNVAETTVRVEVVQLPPKDSKIHAELIGD
ncbi:hypothetical protein D7024_01120 [Desulfofundulus salinus]|uniref:Bacterial Ig-like domain-containing protein n=1 Tax=Desulfofundulus salinus TaxID=2419843 RepID=A0A494WXS5_9FIRM|nr:hypothetical protein D7024_01120 [Desulfofundulus salinum]